MQNSVCAILRQGLDLLDQVSQAEYARPLPMAFNATIGGHYRHCLEHFEALLSNGPIEWVDYDARKRDASVEGSVAAARARTLELIEHFEASTTDGLNEHPVRVRCKTSYDDDCSEGVGSTLERELMYAVVHAVHHFALIRLMANLIGLTLPDHFGKAPSTVQYERAQQSANC